MGFFLIFIGNPLKSLLCRLRVAVFDLHLDGADQVIWPTVAKFEQNLPERLVLAALFGIGSLDVQSLVQLIDSDVAKLDQNLTQKGAVVWSVVR